MALFQGYLGATRNWVGEPLPGSAVFICKACEARVAVPRSSIDDLAHVGCARCYETGIDSEMKREPSSR